MIKRKSSHEYIVDIREGKPSIYDHAEELLKMRSWCHDTFGPGGRNKSCRWRYGWTHTRNYFYFKYEKDALFFCMRWL